MRLSLLASLALATALTPAVGDAQQTGRRDTLRRQDTTVVRQEETGEVARMAANRGLTTEQVRQLQVSLQAIGCEPGAVDGRIGPQTRQALACARRQRNVQSMNLNDLLRSLGLGFTASDSMATMGARDVAGAERGMPSYGDPTFVRDTGVMRINLDTMPADVMGPGGVFVSTGTVTRVGGGVWLRETSQQMRRDTSGRAVPDTVIYRPVTPPPARTDSLVPAALRDTVRDTVPAARRDTVARTPTRGDTAATPARRDTTQTPRRADTTRTARPDTTRPPVADSTLRRMRDELLLMPPPPSRVRPDSTQPDTTRRTPPDSARAKPDSTRTPPDTTRRRPPPIDRR